MFESIDGLPITYSETDVRPGYFKRELNMIYANLGALDAGEQRQSM